MQSALLQGRSRTAYNEWVWDKILKKNVVNSKVWRSGFSFHHDNYR